MAPALTVRIERWPIAGAFTISRGAKTEAVVVVAELTDGDVRGRGECVPYARYGETVEGVVAAIEAMRDAVGARPRPREPCRAPCRRAPPAMRSTARCSISKPSAADSRPIRSPACRRRSRCVTAYTISLASPEEMAEAAAQAAARPLLKVKLGGQGDPDAHRGGAARGAGRRTDRRRQRSLAARRSRCTISPPAPTPA